VNWSQRGGGEVQKKEVVVLVWNKMNGVLKELQQQVALKPSLQQASVADGHEPQLSNPTKERVKGPVGRRLPTKKAQQATRATAEEEDVSAALREFRTAAKRVREARELDEKVEVEKKNEVSDMSRQGIVDPADFDRAWFFRVPSFSCHTTATGAAKGSKNEPTELVCENNNMTSNNNNNNNRDSVVVENSTNEEVALDGGGPEIGSREGSSDASEGSEKKQKRRFWKSREFNCNIL